jgi:hypothetical protein
LAAVASSPEFPPLQGLGPDELPPANVARLYSQEQEFEPHLELLAKIALQHITAKSVDPNFDWEHEESLPVPPNKFPDKPQNAATYVSWLYFKEETFTVGFRSWCKQHLASMIGGSEAVMEAFAEAAYLLFKRMPEDHDWDNEDIIIPQGPPSHDGSDDEDEADPNRAIVPVSLKRRASTFHKEAYQGLKKQKRFESAPVLRRREGGAHLDRRTLLEQARAAVAWQPLYPDIHDDPFDWPLFDVQPHYENEPCLVWLYELRNHLPRQLGRWCKWHLHETMDRDLDGLPALESFARDAYLCFFGVPAGARLDYDWDRAALIQAPVRHLHYLIRHESQEAKDYFNRQIDNDAVNGTDVRTRATRLANVYSNPTNARVDWSQEPDLYKTKDPSLSTTNKLPMHGTHISVYGKWVVSTSSHAFSRLPDRR